MTDDKPDDLTRALPPIWGDDKNLRLKPDNRETELAKALRTILSPDFAVNETASREPQRSLTRMDEPQVDTSAEAVERSEIAEWLRETTREMANRASVPMGLWQQHSSAALNAADLIERYRRRVSSVTAERDELRAVVEGWKECYDRATRLHSSTVRELSAAIARAEAAEAERDALRVVASAAEALRGADRLGYGVNDAFREMTAALDALPPGSLDQEDGR
jgi:hypothetical protein